MVSMKAGRGLPSSVAQPAFLLMGLEKNSAAQPDRRRLIMK